MKPPKARIAKLGHCRPLPILSSESNLLPIHFYRSLLYKLDNKVLTEGGRGPVVNPLPNTLRFFRYVSEHILCRFSRYILYPSGPRGGLELPSYLEAL
jgi:hypothetical protein